MDTESNLDNKNICLSCGKEFCRKSVLTRHIKENRCPNIKSNDNIINDIKNLDENTKTVLNILLEQNKLLVNEIAGLKEKMNLMSTNKTVNNKIINNKNTNSNNKIINNKNTNSNNNTINNLSNTTNNNNIIIAHGTNELKTIDL